MKQATGGAGGRTWFECDADEDALFTQVTPIKRNVPFRIVPASDP